MLKVCTIHLQLALNLPNKFHSDLLSSPEVESLASVPLKEKKTGTLQGP